MQSRSEDVLRLICGVVDAAAVAHKHGVTPEEVEAWRVDYLAAMQRMTEQPRSRKGAALALAAAAVLAMGIGFVSTDAFAQSCPQTLPAPMVTFCPDAPALASSVNGNLQQLVNFIQQKSGTVGTANVTMTGTVSSSGALTSTGAFTATGPSTLNSLTMTGNQSFGNRTDQLINLWGTGYGIGIQNSTLYQRSDNGFAWHRGGVHSNNTNDPGSGGVNVANLDFNGNFAIAGELRAAGLRQRSCGWGGTGPATGADGQYHEVFCPAGSYAVGWRCYANTYIDGACQMYCCYP